MRTDLHVVEHGDAAGTPILAIHGWSPDHRLMTGFLEPLFTRHPGFRRIYPDLPAMGATPVGTVSSTADIVDELDELVTERIGNTPFLLVGESYGGYLSRWLTHRRRDQVRGLCLVAPIGSVVRRADRDRPAPTVFDHDDALIATLDPDEADNFTSVSVSHTAEQLDRFRAEVGSGLAVNDPDGMARIAEQWDIGHPEKAGETAYDGPTLWITGRQDESVGYRDQWALLEHYPRATYAVLDRTGHNVQTERPAIVEALMEDWLDRVEAECQPT